MNKKISRIIALVVVLCMIFTTVAFADPGKKGFEKNSKKVELKDEDYNKALLSLIEKEIVKGYGKGDYGLSGNVKRGDVIVMIIRALGLEGLDTKDLGEKYLGLMTDDKDDFEDEFDDVEIEAYYYGPIKIARELGIAKGDGRYFKPNKPVTIQEAIWLIERADDIIDDDIDIDTDKMDELREIYDGDLNDFAKRRDVFWMLNYVLNGKPDDNKETKLTDIKLDMEDDDEMKFKDSWFSEKFKALRVSNSDVAELDYIKFISVDNGELYYDYDVNDNEHENVLDKKNTEYYLGNKVAKRVDKITLVSNDFSGTITVKYYAVDKNRESYLGYMKITIDNENLLSDVIYTIMKNGELQFEKGHFDKEIDNVTFKFPNSKYGDLYYGESLKNFSIIPDKDEDKIYDDSEISNIIFIPKRNFVGEAIVEYTANINNEEYAGKVVINVLKEIDVDLIDDITMEEGQTKEIKFSNLLDNKLNVKLTDIDYVKFEKPDKGKLYILEKEINNDSEYKMNDLKNIDYKAGNAGLVNIDYVAVDLDNFKAYIGTIEIEVEED